jgi:hypothetical protein
MSSIRRHLSYANVAATLALLFSMGGSAIAASHYAITSTSQIKPSVVRALRGARGPQGPTGPAGSEANIHKLCAGITDAQIGAASDEALYNALNTIYYAGGC